MNQIVIFSFVFQFSRKGKLTGSHHFIIWHRPHKGAMNQLFAL